MRFEEYVEQRGESLLAYAYVLTGNPHDAEDLAQVALTKALSRWSRVRRADNLDAYVRRILTNAFIDSARRRSSSEKPATSEELSRLLPEQGSHEIGILDSFEIQQLIQQLGVRARAMVVMRYLKDLPDREIAAELSVSEATVRSTISRALGQLRERQAAALHRERTRQ